MEELRLEDLSFLNRYYDSGLSNILVVYGHRNIEYTEVLTKFIENRRSFYFTARSVSEREQLFLWANELRKKGAAIGEFPTFGELFGATLGGTNRAPLILVFDSFERVVKTSDNFMNELIKLMETKGRDRQILILLVSQDINWVENSMVSCIGDAAVNIAGFRKIKPVPFSELRAFFPNMSYRDAVLTYSVGFGKILTERFPLRKTSARTSLILIAFYMENHFGLLNIASERPLYIIRSFLRWQEV